MLRYLISHYLEESFQSFGAKTAIEHGERHYTYKAVQNLIRQCQNALLEAGFHRGDKLGILSPVVPEAIITMIACVRSGIIYVPLNIHAPTEWLNTVVDAARLKGVMFDASFSEKQSEILSAYPNLLDINLNIDQQQQLTVLKSHSPIAVTDKNYCYTEVPLLSDDLACILFTSGSTGVPKGIMKSHRNIYTFTEWMKQFFDINTEDRILSRAPLQFDLSEFDIYTSLSAGATLVIPPKGFSESPKDIVCLLREKNITAIYTVPSAYIRLFNKGDLCDLPDLKRLFWAGEPFPPAYLREIMQRLPDTEFWNIYGPTETNIVTYYRVDSLPQIDTSIPIGKPVYDTEILIADESLQEVPVCAIGEIIVRGGTVFKGYLDMPELTSERLVTLDWHSTDDIFCRTGDLGRIGDDGNIIYHGRMDNMVKTRGYRVEIDEVENQISRLNGVGQVTIVAVPHKNYTNALHAFIEPSNEQSCDLTTIEQSLKEVLPSYMVPYRFHLTDILPKTSTGKVDRVGLKKAAMEYE